MSSWQPVSPAESDSDQDTERAGTEKAGVRPGTPEPTADASPWERRSEKSATTQQGQGASVRPDKQADNVAPRDRGKREDKTNSAGQGNSVGQGKPAGSDKALGAETPSDSASRVPSASENQPLRTESLQTGPIQTQPHPSVPLRPIPVPQSPVPQSPVPQSPVQTLSPSQNPSSNVLPPVAAASALDLTNALLVKKVAPPPASGWRKWIHTATGRRINPGNSIRDERMLRLTQQVDRHLIGCYRVSILSLKGGVGKTTTTATLGSTFADIRGDRVIAVDANPDRGTLSQKVPLETPATVRNLLRDIDSLDRYSDVRSYTSQNEFRLEVLASDTDPAVSEAFSGEDYDKAVTLLEKFYSIVLTDCGTGLMHSAMDRILDGSDALVVVSSSSVDGARSASATLDWLDAHGHRDLVRSSVAVVNAVRPRSGKVDLAKVVEHFEQRCRQVVLIPFDPHLEEGAEIDLGRLKRRTRSALLELAAAVASGFPSNRPDDIQRMQDQRSQDQRARVLSESDLHMENG